MKDLFPVFMLYNIKHWALQVPPDQSRMSTLSMLFIQETLEKMKVRVCKKATDWYFSVT